MCFPHRLMKYELTRRQRSLKKVQGKKKRDAAAAEEKKAAEGVKSLVDDGPSEGGPGVSNLLDDKDEDVIF